MSKRDVFRQRVTAYRASPGEGTANADDNITADAHRGIAEIEAYLAEIAGASLVA